MCMYKVDNAIIMAAGLSSRFAPLSYEMPKGLIKVKGEVLIERQIRQLKEAGISEIIIVTGYKAEQFSYLKDKFKVTLLHNPYFDTRNNNYSLYVAQDYLKNSYICSADNYFTINPFESNVDESYYSAIYVDGHSDEWCIHYDENEYITNVVVGGSDEWVMLGHVFFSEVFSQKFLEILRACVDDDKVKEMLWESIFLQHLDTLSMKIRKYQTQDIYEFDSLDELRLFDESYLEHANSSILKQVCALLNCKESAIHTMVPYKDGEGKVVGFQFRKDQQAFMYSYEEETLKESL